MYWSRRRPWSSPCCWTGGTWGGLQRLLVIQTHEKRGASFHPVLRRLLPGLQVYRHHKRGVTRASGTIWVVVARSCVETWKMGSVIQIGPENPVVSSHKWSVSVCVCVFSHCSRLAGVCVCASWSRLAGVCVYIYIYINTWSTGCTWRLWFLFLFWLACLECLCHRCL